MGPRRLLDKIAGPLRLAALAAGSVHCALTGRPEVRAGRQGPVGRRLHTAGGATNPHLPDACVPVLLLLTISGLSPTMVLTSRLPDPCCQITSHLICLP